MKMKFVTNKWTGGTLLAGLSLIGLPAFAQEAGNFNNGASAPPESAQMAGAQGERLPITASVGIAEQFNSKVSNNGGPEPTFSITRFNVGVKAPVRLNDKFQLGTSFRYGLDAFNFNSLPAGTATPWRNINTLQAASILAYKVDDTWSVYGGGFVKLSADSDVALGKGATGGILGGFNYKVNDTLDLGAGFAVANQIQTRAMFVPLFTARWQFADQWRLDAGLTDVATTGYGAEVKWLFSDAWNFGFGVQYHKSRFRIASPDGTGGDGAGQEKAATIYADATWHATPKVDVDGFVGVAAGGNVAAYDNARNKTWGYNYKPAPILGLKGSVRF
ncbi:MAG TPA: DUF6268 family outer membrane beta-barrel protein [Verrucomicrobiae bacterium]|nr:DUF6268 family outer membrane beta-barrel protein [Verrucomicrobiae bacterium]